MPPESVSVALAVSTAQVSAMESVDLSSSRLTIRQMAAPMYRQASMPTRNGAGMSPRSFQYRGWRNRPKEIWEKRSSLWLMSSESCVKPMEVKR